MPGAAARRNAEMPLRGEPRRCPCVENRALGATRSMAAPTVTAVGAELRGRATTATPSRPTRRRTTSPGLLLASLGIDVQRRYRTTTPV